MCAAHGEWGETSQCSARIRKKRKVRQASESDLVKLLAVSEGRVQTELWVKQRLRVILFLLPSAEGTVFHSKLYCRVAQIYKKEV
jgi:hypothetical protein